MHDPIREEEHVWNDPDREGNVKCSRSRSHPEWKNPAEGSTALSECHGGLSMHRPIRGEKSVFDARGRGLGSDSRVPVEGSKDDCHHAASHLTPLPGSEVKVKAPF